MKRRADEIILPGSDEAFFRDHPDRNYRIRKLKDDREFAWEFAKLGAQNYPTDRWAVIVIRAVAFPFARPGMPRVLAIPFIKFADEEIADNDETLAPIVLEMMTKAKQDYDL